MRHELHDKFFQKLNRYRGLMSNCCKNNLATEDTEDTEKKICVICVIWGHFFLLSSSEAYIKIDCPKNKTFSVILIGIKIASLIGINILMNEVRDRQKMKIKIFGVDMLLWYNRMTLDDNHGPGAGEPGLCKM